MKNWLFNKQGMAYLLEEYLNKQRSTYEIAKDQNTYPNLVRRALLSHGIKLRDKGTAQSIALESGRHAHPTKGRERTENEKRAISESKKRLHGDSIE